MQVRNQQQQTGQCMLNPPPQLPRQAKCLHFMYASIKTLSSNGRRTRNTRTCCSIHLNYGAARNAASFTPHKAAPIFSLLQNRCCYPSPLLLSLGPPQSAASVRCASSALLSSWFVGHLCVRSYLLEPCNFFNVCTADRLGEWPDLYSLVMRHRLH